MQTIKQSGNMIVIAALLVIAVILFVLLVGQNKPVSAQVNLNGASFNLSEQFLDKWLGFLLLGERPGEDALGAGTRFPNGISADTTSPSAAGNIRGTTFTLTGASTYGGDVTIDTTDFFVDVSANTVGFGSSTPWGLLSVESTTDAETGTPIFVIGDQGTSTPFFIVEANAGAIGFATATPLQELSLTGDAVFSSGATTTLSITSTSATVGAGCIELSATDGVMTRIYVDGDNGTSLKVEAGTCQ